MRAVLEFPAGRDERFAPGMTVDFPAGLPLTMDGREVGTVLDVTANDDGSALEVTVELFADVAAPWGVPR